MSPSGASRLHCHPPASAQPTVHFDDVCLTIEGPTRSPEGSLIAFGSRDSRGGGCGNEGIPIGSVLGSTWMSFGSISSFRDDVGLVVELTG